MINAIFNSDRRPIKAVAMLVNLSMVMALAACSGENPSAVDAPSGLADTQLKPADIQEPAGGEGEVDLELATQYEGNAEPAGLQEEGASSELDQSIINSINVLTARQNQNIEASSVLELEQLSEADRQSLQATAAEKTMKAAEQLAAKQLEGSATLKAIE